MSLVLPILFFFKLSLSLSLSLTHTHTLSLSFSPSPTHMFACWPCAPRTNDSCPRVCFHALATHPTDTPCPVQCCKTALDVATNDEVKAALRQHGARHSLFYAVEQGMLELVADLIKEGADMNERDKVSLYRVLSVAFSV